MKSKIDKQINDKPKKQFILKRLFNEMFCSANGIEAIYVYVFILFTFLFIMFGVRIASVFTNLNGEILSDTLLIGLATQIIALIVNHTWRRKK